MRVQCLKQIRDEILSFDCVKLFTVQHFKHIANPKVIERDILRLINEGIVQRVINGLFFNVIKIDEEIVYPSLESVAYAIGKKFVWDIRPDKQTSLYLLGLTDKKSDEIQFISNGPYRVFNVFGKTIKFNHVANKEISGVSLNTSLIIQAIKAIGVSNLTIENRLLIKEKIEDPNKLLQEIEFQSEKIVNVINEIITM